MHSAASNATFGWGYPVLSACLEVFGWVSEAVIAQILPEQWPACSRWGNSRPGRLIARRAGQALAEREAALSQSGWEGACRPASRQLLTRVARAGIDVDSLLAKWSIAVEGPCKYRGADRQVGTLGCRCCCLRHAQRRTKAAYRGLFFLLVVAGPLPLQALPPAHSMLSLLNLEVVPSRLVL